jgi:hypothetical protein
MPDSSPPEIVYRVNTPTGEILTTSRARAEGWAAAGAEVHAFSIVDPELSARVDEHAEALLELGDEIYGGPWTSARTLVATTIERLKTAQAMHAQALTSQQLFEETNRRLNDRVRSLTSGLARPTGQLEGARTTLRVIPQAVDKEKLHELLGEVVEQLKALRVGDGE